MKNSVAKNMFYQSIFQVMKILMPIISVPIVSAAFGPDGIGISSYTNSIAQYFILISALGISLYGSRTIATVRDDKNLLNKTFWELFYLKVITTSISLLAYLLCYKFLFVGDLQVFFLLQAINIYTVFFDISWFFMGIEDFKKTSMVSLIVQILTFIGIVLFIKDINDLWLYIAIQGLGNLFSQLGVWLFIFKEIKIVKINFKDIFKHFKPTLAYFIPQVGVIMYTTLNKTMLGFLGTETQVGLYANATNLTSICITLITTLDLVMLPKMSNLFSKNLSKAMEELLMKSIHIQLFFSIPTMLGLVALVPNLVPWFFGAQFSSIPITIYSISILIVVVPFGMAISRQYLLPAGKTREYTQSIFLGGIIGIILNVMLIPTIGIVGAILSTLCSEFFVALHRYISIKKDLPFNIDLKNVIKIFLSAVCMFIAIRVSNYFLTASVLTTLIQIVIGALSYIIMVMLMKNTLALSLSKLVMSKLSSLKNKSS